MSQNFHFGFPAPDVGGVVVGAGHGHDHRSRRIVDRRRLHDGHRTVANVIIGRLFVHHHDVAHVVVVVADAVHHAHHAAVDDAVQVVRGRRHFVVDRDRGQRAAAAGYRLRHGAAQLRRVATVVAAHRRRPHHHGRRVHDQMASRPQSAGPRPVTRRTAVVGRRLMVMMVADQRGRLVQIQLARVSAATHVLTPVEIEDQYKLRVDIDYTRRDYKIYYRYLLNIV